MSNAILTETLACFLPGRAKDLSAPPYVKEKICLCWHFELTPPCSPNVTLLRRSWEFILTLTLNWMADCVFVCLRLTMSTADCLTQSAGQTVSCPVIKKASWKERRCLSGVSSSPVTNHISFFTVSAPVVTICTTDRNVTILSIPLTKLAFIQHAAERTPQFWRVIASGGERVQ